MSISKRSLKLFLAVFTSLSLLACSNSTSTSESDTGSIAFSLAWSSDAQRLTQALNDPDIDCDLLNIASIDVGVYEATGILIKGESFECSRGEGTVDGISTGSNRIVLIFAKDSNGSNLYEAEVTGVDISIGEITDIGTVLVEAVDPGADSDGDGVTDDDDQCPLTPSGLEVDTNGCIQTFANALGMDFIHISLGSFTMGSPIDEFARGDDETQHEVTLTMPFYMQITEVTQAQWEDVMGSNPSNFSGCSNCPVEMVTWNDVQEFITDLNTRSEGIYSLPTEAQWEYTARAGSTTAFANGEITEYSNNDECNYDANLDAMGWYCNNSNDATHEVAQKNPNVWKLYDMHGNVAEWCQDLYQSDLGSDPVSNPTGPTSGSLRVVRGGSWYGYPKYSRSASRFGNTPGEDYISVGFRLIRYPARFKDMGDGTVLDYKTGLVWLKDADSFGMMPWSDAMAAAATLSNGEHGLTDGSVDGDWRLPTIADWEAFVDTTYTGPVLCNTLGNGQWSEGDPFTGVQSYFHWSSTDEDGCAWRIGITYGGTSCDGKNDDRYVWPVRPHN